MAAKPHLFSSKMETRILEWQRLQALGSRDKQRIECTVLLQYGLACLLAPLLLSQMVAGATWARNNHVQVAALPQRKGTGNGGTKLLSFLHRLCKVRKRTEAAQNEEAKVRQLTRLVYVCQWRGPSKRGYAASIPASPHI